MSKPNPETLRAALDALLTRMSAAELQAIATLRAALALERIADRLELPGLRAELALEHIGGELERLPENLRDTLDASLVGRCLPSLVETAETLTAATHEGALVVVVRE